MNVIQQKLNYLRSQYNSTLDIVVFMAVTIFVFSVFDSILSYLVPNVFIASGLSESQMGLLYASSSFFGLIFDLALARYLTSINYKRTLLYAISIALLVPLALYVFPSTGLFLLGMAFWGLYYNLWGFASADFSAKESKVAFHVASVSILMLTHDLGYLSGTLAVEPLLAILAPRGMLFVLLALGTTSLASFLYIATKKGNSPAPAVTGQHEGKSIKIEISLLGKVLRKLYPLLLMGIVVSTVDAVTWTITPVIDTIFPEIGKLGGVVLAINFLPSFFAYSLAIPLTSRYGKKKVGSLAFVSGALALILLGQSPTVVIYMAMSFVSSFFITISYAAFGGAYVDYLKESDNLDNEIVSVRDMATNIGYILGPIIGGVLLSTINSIALFSYLGTAVAAIGIGLFLYMPKKISFVRT